MFYTIRTAVVFLIIMTLITGVLYTGAFVILGKFIFPKQASGSLIKKDDKVIGSELIGQNFNKKGYFYGRPSNAGEGYDSMASSGSNLAQSNKKLSENIEKRASLFKQDQKSKTKIPVDLVTSSGSGLDPHISPAAAYIQVSRVAKERNISEKKLRDLIRQHTEKRLFGVFGEERVNVLKLNLALSK